MADPVEAKPAAPVLGRPGQAAVDVQVGDGVTHSLDLGMRDLKQGENRHAVEGSQDAITAEVGTGDNDRITRADANLDAAKPIGEAPAPVLDAEGKQVPVVEATAATPLPDYDEAKPEVVTAYTERYLGAGGAPDLDKVSQDWKPTLDAQGNITGGDLPEATYKFLASKGYDKKTIKGIEAGQIAIAQADRASVFGLAGGEETYRQAQAWGSANWTQEQRDVFNADRNAGGVRRENAVKGLVLAFTTAVPKGRRASPARSVGDGGGNNQGGEGNAVKGYDSKSDWQADVRKAQATNNQALLNESRARLKASEWYTG
jgi:hypothetical protein